MWQLYRLFLREGIVLFGKIINFVHPKPFLDPTTL